MFWKLNFHLFFFFPKLWDIWLREGTETMCCFTFKISLAKASINTDREQLQKTDPNNFRTV